MTRHINVKTFFLYQYLFYLFFSKKINAATCTAIASTNWTLASTWSCGSVPSCNDVINIPSGYTVTITSAINLTGGGCTNTKITIGGVLFFSGNASKIDLVTTATITINSGGKITTDQPGNNSQKITIGNGQAEWSSNQGSISGPWVIKDGTSISTLPVELTDFSAECISKGVQLNWSTISEENNDFFILESSKDGLSWTEVAKVKGAGTVGYFKKYIHTDLNNDNGLRYYRLSQVDFDKTKKVLRIIDLNCNNSKNEMILFPNPSSTELNILLNVSEQENNGLMKLYNLQGQVVFENPIQLIEGANSFSFPIELQSGTYHAVFTSDKVNIPAQKIIIVKP